MELNFDSYQIAAFLFVAAIIICSTEFVLILFFYMKSLKDNCKIKKIYTEAPANKNLFYCAKYTGYFVASETTYRIEITPDKFYTHYIDATAPCSARFISSIDGEPQLEIVNCDGKINTLFY